MAERVGFNYLRFQQSVMIPTDSDSKQCLCGFQAINQFLVLSDAVTPNHWNSPKIGITGITCSAALTALKAYLVAGKPAVLKRPALGSFEEWDRLVCGCLVWLGYADPIASQGAVEESDPEREANLELLTTWYSTLGEPMSVGKIGAQSLNPVRELLAGAEGWNAKAVGVRLKKLDKKVISGFKLKSKNAHGVRLWYVTKDGKVNSTLPKPVGAEFNAW